MNKGFYFGTSIWLDFFEEMNEPSMLKSDWAKELIANISLDKDIIVFSDINLIELIQIEYSEFEMEQIGVTRDLF